MRYTSRFSTKAFNGSIPATENALYNSAKAYGDKFGKMIRGLYYEYLKDPFTGHTHVTIKVWFT